MPEPIRSCVFYACKVSAVWMALPSPDNLRCSLASWIELHWLHVTSRLGNPGDHFLRLSCLSQEFLQWHSQLRLSFQMNLGFERWHFLWVGTCPSPLLSATLNFAHIGLIAKLHVFHLSVPTLEL